MLQPYLAWYGQQHIMVNTSKLWNGIAVYMTLLSQFADNDGTRSTCATVTLCFSVIPEIPLVATAAIDQQVT